MTAAIAGIALAALATLGVRLQAQDGPGRDGKFSWETRITKTAEVYGVPDLTGTWVVTKREHPVTAKICDSHTDSRKLPRNPCRFDASLLHLTDRANAWLNWADERIEGKYYCVPESIPSVLVRDYPVRIEQWKDHVYFEHQITIHNTAIRTAWTDAATIWIPTARRSITATPSASTRATTSSSIRPTSRSTRTASTT
jgi:hypothetical protein